MSDAQFAEGRQLNLHTAGTDMVEVSGIAVATSTGAAAVTGAVTADNLALSLALNVNAINLGYDGTNTDLLRTTGGITPYAAGLQSGILAVQDTDGDISIPKSATQLRDTQTAERTVILTDTLADAITANLWAITDANGGTSAVSSGETLVQTSANANGSSQMAGQVPVPLNPGTEWSFTGQLRVGDTGLAGNSRRWGLFTVSALVPQDGFYFELTGTTFNVVAVKAGSTTKVASGSFTRNSTAPFVIDTNYHLYEIDIIGDAAYFAIDGITRHILPLNTVAVTRTASLKLPMTFQSINVASAATNALLGIRTAAVVRFGLAQTMPRSVTPFQASVAASASSVVALAANPSRVGATIYNDSSSVAYLKLGATASTTSFTYKMNPNDYYEVPFGYTGEIDMIWTTATGNARITEVV